MLGVREVPQVAVPPNVRQQALYVQTLLANVAAGDVRDSRNADVAAGQLSRGVDADVAKAMQNRGGANQPQTDLAGGFFDAVDHAAAGGLLAEHRATDVDGLSGDDVRRELADVLGVSVHYPGHGEVVSAHIGSRDVEFRADEGGDFRGVAAC